MNRAFNHDMLILGRTARGLTQAALVEHAPVVSQSKLSKIEGGLMRPSDEEVDAFASALSFRPAFFYKPHSRRAMPAAYHRKRQKLTKSEWEVMFARSELVRISISEMLNSVELAQKKRTPPSVDIDEYGGDIDSVARAIRQLWSLPRGPIDDLTRAIESSGIIVFHMDFGTDLIDGFSQHGMDGFPPIIYVNRKLPIDRLRFTLGHELGHLVMHLMPNPEMENQANRFSSAFLMPSEDIRHEFYSMSMDRLMALKLTWKTAMSALVRRARDVGRMTESTYKYYNIELRRRWGTKEPVQITDDIERPRIVRQLYDAHTSTLGYSAAELAALFGWHEDDVERTFGANRPKLRLVVG
jgi:Zn-dependent peptidase ImmA (M78 family)/transcriptional regulator with XRE-family HTH domain